ncbi:MAG: ATPase, T2SS/T4P/T4SS family [Rickettsiales bacterium]
MAIRQFQPGETIFQAGQPSDVAYMVQEGQVEVTDRLGVAQTVGKGHLFGEVSVIQNAPRAGSAKALSEVTLRSYTSEDLEALVYQTPMEVQQMVMHLARASQKRVGEPPRTVNTSEAAGNGAAMEAFAHSIERLADMLDARCASMEQRMQTGSAAAPATVEDDADDDGREKLTDELLKELTDLGPLKPLLADESINDILINGPDNIFVERYGKLEKTDVTFPNDAEVFKIADKIVRTIGRKIDRRRPLIDARLLDGSRVNIIAPPLAVDGTSISIRKFAQKKYTLEVMAEQQNVSPQLADFLRICGKVRLNVLISGGTGSGKTTLLNAVSRHIEHDERVVTIEDAAELQLQQPHVVRLETKPITSGASAREEVTMRDLVKNALRMRPDRILVGEVRGPEAFDMMQAMNTGHEGSLTTIHANHPRDALSRLENMVAMANLNIPHSSIRYQIASAINLIIQVSRMRDGHRRITHVCEIVGMEGDIITMQDLFNFVIDGEDGNGKLRGSFRWSGIMPRFLRRVAYYGEAENLSKALGVKLPKF